MPIVVPSVHCMLLVAGAGCRFSIIFFCVVTLTRSYRLQCIRRGEIREKGHMDKNLCGDCMVSLCCHCCAVIQQEKEVEALTSGVVSHSSHLKTCVIEPTDTFFRTEQDINSSRA